jgi:hypothetical protein
MRKVGDPNTRAAQHTALRPLVLPMPAPPVELPPHDLRAPQASLPPMILYECICICKDEYLHMNEHELIADKQLHFCTE